LHFDTHQIHSLAAQVSEFLSPTPVPSPELWLSPSQSYGLPPPSYDDTIADLPPDYTTTEALATAQTPQDTPFGPSLCSNVLNCLPLTCNTSPTSIYFDQKSFHAYINLGFSEEGVRSHAKKKKGPAKKAAFNWDDEGDEMKENDLAGGSGGGDGGGDPPADGGAAGGGGGTGGDGGDGGDGDKDKNEEDDWGAWGTSKKSKRKSKKALVEEEAEPKEKEEETASAAAATTTTGNDLAWVDQAQEENMDDDWGAFAFSGKKDKSKRKKVGSFVCLNIRCKYS
jgi:hypothetical protein